MRPITLASNGVYYWGTPAALPAAVSAVATVYPSAQPPYFTVVIPATEPSPAGGALVS